jgi:hypothetical protein
VSEKKVLGRPSRPNRELDMDMEDVKNIKFWSEFFKKLGNLEENEKTKLRVGHGRVMYGGANWIPLAQDKVVDKFVNSFIKTRNYSTDYESVKFSDKVSQHGVCWVVT